MGGGLTNKKSKAFTLIELLAIIVILAIIAVITVPIILNIIENSKKGAAQDSAYGFKDSIYQYYADALSENKNLKLEGEYTISDGNLTGKFEGPESESKTITILVSGEKPSSGSLHYTNSVLDGGYLVIGDYKVTFNQDGKIDKTEKNTGSSLSEQVDSDPVLVDFTLDEMCPNCIFSTYGDQNINEELSLDVFTYDELGYLPDNFMGFIVDNNIVKRAFVCSSSENEPICIEGYDTTKYERNMSIMQHFDFECENVEDSGHPNYAIGENGESVTISYTSCANFSISNWGFVEADGSGSGCYVLDDGTTRCE